MITFRILDKKRGDLFPRVEPRAYYKAYLLHINNRRDHNSHIRVSTRYFSNGDIIKTATIKELDKNV